MNTVVCKQLMPPKQVTHDGADQPGPPEREANDPHALERRLLRHLTRKTGCKEAARDIAQEAYLRFFQMPEDRRLRSPDSYLFKIALNLVEEVRERESGVVDFDSTAADGIGLMLENEEPSAYDSLSIEETLLAAVADLPPIQNKVLWMSKVEGLSYKEIAERLDQKLETVKTLAARALRRARKALTSDGLE